MEYGYNGKVLRVDLTRGNISVEEPEERFYRQYLGGKGLISYYLLNEQRSGVDPLSPQNKLVFAAGVVTGAPLGGSGRNAIGAKSPLTNALCSSEVGGYWGAELNHAGYDAIIIEGKAKAPVYLWIQDGKVEIRDATHLWGKFTGETQELIRKELGDSLVRTALIGPGGEKLVRFACIVNDLRHFAGRGGLGAVMGSKNLKGIAVRGHNPPAMADPEAIKTLAKWFRDIVTTHPFVSDFHEEGTLGGIPAYSRVGGLPTRNYQEGVFAGASKIGVKTYMNTIESGRDTCYACPVRCKHVVAVGKPYDVSDKYYHGPEFETVISFGSFCGVDDLGAVAKANGLCSAHGVDTISCGSTIAFAMECFQRGLLTEEDIGFQLNFGDAKAMVKAVEMVCKREGFGDILAEGSIRAARKISGGVEQYAMHVKGQEIPMHAPHFKPITGLGYALYPGGADHVCNLFFPQALESPGPGVDQYKPLGLLDPLPREDFSSPARIRQYMYATLWASVADCLAMCFFCAVGYQQHRVTEIVRAVTGWDTTLWELMKVGERCMNMMRAFNIREGFTAQDDRLPERFHQPLAEGPLKDFRLDKEKFEGAKKTYFGMMGWDQNGVPRREKLQELDIEWVAEEL
ncbi:putative oxidoreductase YdhV [subsurface metagenome]